MTYVAQSRPVKMWPAVSGIHPVTVFTNSLLQWPKNIGWCPHSKSGSALNNSSTYVEGNVCKILQLACEIGWWVLQVTACNSACVFSCFIKSSHLQLKGGFGFWLSEATWCFICVTQSGEGLLVFKFFDAYHLTLGTTSFSYLYNEK